jgi:arylsulfatase A-like enzyme
MKKTNTILTMSMLAASFCGHAFATKPIRPVSKAPVVHPNVILIYADDMGKGMISAYGQQQFSTPNMDYLIHHGVAFERAYGCMLSAPARASLLTGYHDCHGRDKWNISGGGAYLCTLQDTASIAKAEADINKNDVSLPAGDLYLPQVFKKAGYTTAQIGKLEWGFTATRAQMKNHGWDYYYGYLDHVRCHGFYPPFLFDNGRIVPISGNTRTNCGKSVEQETEQTFAERRDRSGKEVYSQDIFVDKILQFIRTHKDKPFFLYHPTQLPHGPVAVPAIDPEIAANPHLTPIEKEYASMVKLLDTNIGLILAELQKQGLDKRTVIIFASDNGHEIYYAQHGRCEKPYRNLTNGELFDDYQHKYYSNLSGDIFNGNASMAGLKRSNLEGGVHVPLVFYGPGIIPSGKPSHRLISNYDLLPTIADWLGVSLSVPKDGHSYLSALLHGDTAQRANSYVVFGSNTGPGMVTAEGWKLRYYLKQKAWELFFLPNDSQERHDLSKKYPQRLEQLKAALLKECGGSLDRGVNRAG